MAISTYWYNAKVLTEVQKKLITWKSNSEEKHIHKTEICQRLTEQKKRTGKIGHLSLARFYCLQKDAKLQSLTTTISPVEICGILVAPHCLAFFFGDKKKIYISLQTWVPYTKIKGTSQLLSCHTHQGIGSSWNFPTKLKWPLICRVSIS